MVALDQRLKSTLQSTIADFIPLNADELIVFCPGCKALDTVLHSDGELIRSHRFIQSGDRVFHSCGSRTPCRLYRSCQGF